MTDNFLHTRALLILLLALLSSLDIAAAAEPLTVAVAANFGRPMQELSRAFTAETAIQVRSTIASTGTLYAQIRNGAPYDLFLAADEERPDLLHQQGLAQKPVVYARGQVALFSRDQALCAAATWQDALHRLEDNKQGKIGIANPQTAPYGAAAAAALRATGLWERAKARLVYAGNVGQAQQYGSMGTVRATFTAHSLTLDRQSSQPNCSWPVSEASLVVQKGCVISHSPRQDLAQSFLDFLHTEPALTILGSYGYH